MSSGEHEVNIDGRELRAVLEELESPRATPARSSAASRGHVAFDQRVQVEPTDDDRPRLRRDLLSRIRTHQPTAAVSRGADS